LLAAPSRVRRQRNWRWDTGLKSVSAITTDPLGNVITLSLKLQNFSSETGRGAFSTSLIEARIHEVSSSNYTRTNPHQATIAQVKSVRARLD
jgi:hypothetical protein